MKMGRERAEQQAHMERVPLRSRSRSAGQCLNQERRLRSGRGTYAKYSSSNTGKRGPLHHEIRRQIQRCRHWEERTATYKNLSLRFGLPALLLSVFFLVFFLFSFVLSLFLSFQTVFISSRSGVSQQTFWTYVKGLLVGTQRCTRKETYKQRQYHGEKIR